MNCTVCDTYTSLYLNFLICSLNMKINLFHSTVINYKIYNKYICVEVCNNLLKRPKKLFGQTLLLHNVLSYLNWHILVKPTGDVQWRSNFRTSVSKFEIDLHTFGIRISDWNLSTIFIATRTMKNTLMLLFSLQCSTKIECYKTCSQ